MGREGIPEHDVKSVLSGARTDVPSMAPSASIPPLAKPVLGSVVSSAITRAGGTECNHLTRRQSMALAAFNSRVPDHFLTK